jgi:Sec7-like guanine-nucleotide exchange factor
MRVKLFILGRPGSGKSTVARYISKLAQHEGWVPTIYCDYNILYSLFQAELHKPFCPQQHFEPVDHNGFRVIDFSALDPALHIIQKKAIASLNDCSPYTQRLFVIEFARDDYIKALHQFDPAFLQDAHFLFLDADVDLCIQRIHNRVTHPASIDDHFVSDDIITGYYQKDSTPDTIRKLANRFALDEQKMRYVETYSSRDEFLHDYVRDYARHLLERTSSRSRITRPLFGAFSSGTIYCPSNCPPPSANPLLAALSTDSSPAGVSADQQSLPTKDESLRGYPDTQPVEVFFDKELVEAK